MRLRADFLELANTLEKHKLILEENNPNKILENGYAVLSDRNDHIISSAGELSAGDQYKISPNRRFCPLSDNRDRK